MLNISNWKSRYSREPARGLPLLGQRGNCVSSHMVKNSSIRGQNTYEYIKAQVGNNVLHVLFKKLAVLLFTFAEKIQQMQIKPKFYYSSG